MKRNALFVLALLFTFVFLGCEKNPITPNDEPPIVTPPVIESNLDFEVHTEVESNEIRELNQAMAAKGLMPTWVDGFRHKGGNSTQQYNEYLFNVVYTENTDDINWHLFLDLTKTQLEEKLLSFGADGFQAHQLESYWKDGKMRYAVILKEGVLAEQYFAIEMSNANYQQLFDDKVAEGYRLLSRSVLFDGDEKVVTALFGPNDVTSWRAFTTLDEAGIQEKMEASKEAGRAAVYLDISQKGLTDDVRYSPIFANVPHSNWYALNKLDSDEMKAEINEARDNGYTVTFVCGYDEFGLINGNEVHFLRYAVGFKK